MNSPREISGLSEQMASSFCLSFTGMTCVCVITSDSVLGRVVSDASSFSALQWVSFTQRGRERWTLVLSALQVKGWRSRALQPREQRVSGVQAWWFPSRASASGHCMNRNSQRPCPRQDAMLPSAAGPEVSHTAGLFPNVRKLEAACLSRAAQDFWASGSTVP